MVEYVDVDTAHQYKVRVQKSIEESESPYWTNLDLSLTNAEVRPVEMKFARTIIEEYEWLGCMAAVNFYAFGIFFEDVCGGVVVFGQEYAENLGVWDKYGYTGKIILLNRGVCLHWTPKNTGSKLIMTAIKLLPPKYEVVTCTVDHLAGEVGTIYQACNFIYVGQMRKTKDRVGLLLDGKLLGERAIRTKFGHQRKKEILEQRPDAKFVKQKSKDRYFLFRGNKRTQRKHKSALSAHIKPYPKRANPCDLEEVTKTVKEEVTKKANFSLTSY